MTRNPRDPSPVPGGSSPGAAALVGAIGPIAGSVADLDAVLRSITGPDGMGAGVGPR
ncbi:hypothetical protein [Nonomuraea sp. NPDC048826]|uniref:hypothetical protein n=1 Tax=Nonomuraea sp. NPDC048826 TaxID=3364347 RepID=UPI003719ECE0